MTFVSTPISKFIPAQNLNLSDLSFSLYLNGNNVQQGNTSNMIWNIDEIISFVSRYFTLKTGDLIFTGTPHGVGKISVGDHIEGFIGDEKMLDFYVR